jgi:hypothetical protein
MNSTWATDPDKPCWIPLKDDQELKVIHLINPLMMFNPNQTMSKKVISSQTEDEYLEDMPTGKT